MRTLIPILWFSLAIWFLWGSSSTRADVLGEVPRTPAVDKADIDPLALRPLLGDPPRIEIGSVLQKCSDCHALFASLDVTPGSARQHEHIELDHGLNDRCYNCHARTDRNKLVLRDGTHVQIDDSTQLCSQCHGTVYRDWERGMHGRTVGSWDADSGQQSRLGCVSCHDPHAPAFPPIRPLPGPNTWRMPAPSAGHPDESWRDNPLERWKRPSHDASPSRSEH